MSTTGQTIARAAPPYYYVAYIDESGDPGLERVRPIDNPGGSEWLTMGGVLIEQADEALPVDWVRSILTNIGTPGKRQLHFREMRDWRKPPACQALASLPVRLFAMCSNKKNMRQHRNERAAAKSSPLHPKDYFYNFCLRILLERMTEFVFRDSIARYSAPRHMKIVFARRDGHGWGHAFAYNELLRRQSQAGTTFLGKRTIRWEVVDYRLLEKESITTTAGCQLADIVTSAFYQAVDVLPPTHFDPRNAQLLKPRMASHHGAYENEGLTFAPWNYWRADLLPEQIDIFEFYGFQRFDFHPPPRR